MNDIISVCGRQSGGSLAGDFSRAFKLQSAFAGNNFLDRIAVNAFKNDISRAAFIRTEIGDVQNILMRDTRNGARFLRENCATIFSSMASVGARILIVTGLSIETCVAR